MTTDEYLNLHLPHRIILLTTFRERFWNISTTKNYEIYDLFRCSKDISMLMVRFFLCELGIGLKEGDNDVSIYKKWQKGFGLTQLTIKEVQNDNRYNDIMIVLSAANRAVAHFEPDYVNHSIQTKEQHIILVNAINFTEEQIIEKMYNVNKKDYEKVMSTYPYDMKRKPILIS